MRSNRIAEPVHMIESSATPALNDMHERPKPYYKVIDRLLVAPEMMGRTLGIP
jgi:hypothetical protein